MRIDSHQHFWQFDPTRDSWMNEKTMSVIRHDFLPKDLKPHLDRNGFDGCVVVQVDQSETENTFLLDLAQKNNFIKGVVGWVDLKSKNLNSDLERLSQNEKIKGFRHILQGEKPEFMLDAKFSKGIGELKKHNFTYDILVFPKHLNAVKKLLAQHKSQPFVIDHLAKPYIKKGLIKQWQKDTKSIAKHENVYCKVSGIVTEADWKNWKENDVKPYLDVIFEAFGTDRIVYGSDWPVCLLAADYDQQLSIIKNYISKLTETEKNKIMGENATRFYKL
jgi:L-fuconolactonase